MRRLLKEGKYSVHQVARFKEELWYNAKEGCYSDKVARIKLMNRKYANQFEEIIEKINKYSKLREKNNTIVLVRKKSPLILRVV